MGKSKRNKLKVQISSWFNNGLATAFGALAIVVGVSANAQPGAMVALAVMMVGFYAFAVRQGWLLKGGSQKAVSDSLVTAAFALCATVFVRLTGSAHSPFLCALYLPVLLASLIFSLRLGMTTALGMLLICAAVASQGHLPAHGLSWLNIAVGFSFPLAAVFGRLLSLQMEERYVQRDREAKNLSALLDMSQMMDTAADLDTTLNLVLFNVQKLTGCPICAIYLKSASGSRLELRAANGLRERVVLQSSLPLEQARWGDWDLAQAAAYGTDTAVCYIPDCADRDAERAAQGLGALDLRAQSFACVPLSSLEGLIGLLYVGYDAPRGLDSEGVGRLEQLATRAAFSLQRVIFQQDYQSLAYSDAMTGLDNFRRFEENLAEEMRRAERYDRPLSLILLDIDHFKSFNDTLGHQAGDALLGQLATVLRDCLRSVDKPARYGGEEFVVLCPETGGAEAALIAERIRRSVAQATFALVDQEQADRSGLPRTTTVTVSVGFATFPRDARSPRDLIRCADKALYAAKHAGRNTVRGKHMERVEAQVA